MKVQAALAGVLSLAGLASTTSAADPSWHDLAISAPHYGRYLYRTASEEPFFWQADTAWELTHRLNKTSIDFYLKTRAEQGYNVVQTVVISELNGTTSPNFYGDLPFNNSDPSKPNEAYFELVDWTVDLAATYGILIPLEPTWGIDYYAAQINQNTSGSWRKDIFFEGATQIQYVTKPLSSLSTATLEQLEPARELLSSPSNHTGKSVNTYEGTRYISILASKDRDRYYVYTGHGDTFSLQLENGSGNSRSGSATWFSPRDGQYYASSTVSVPASGNGTRVDFTPPSTGGIDNDWLLVVEF
uniref:DUF4038 domain-containing protein n=1 Tax=Phytophthora ramorum TaxID=164328 RepID=H3H8W2_PHYRM